MSKISARIERPIAGVLGYSFLKDRIIQIDYGNLKLRFFADSPYPRIQMAPNTVNTIAMTFRREEGDVIVDSVFVNNEKMRATLDTVRAAVSPHTGSGCAARFGRRCR
jgi:hypothetical protein